MFLTSLLIAPAMAQEAAASGAEPGAAAGFMQFLPLFLIFAVVYFLMIRPQQKRMDEHTSLLKDLKKGDEVVTNAGFVGKIVKIIDEEYFMLKLAEGVEVKITRASIEKRYNDKKD